MAFGCDGFTFLRGAVEPLAPARARLRVAHGLHVPVAAAAHRPGRPPGPRAPAGRRARHPAGRPLPGTDAGASICRGLRRLRPAQRGPARRRGRRAARCPHRPGVGHRPRDRGTPGGARLHDPESDGEGVALHAAHHPVGGGDPPLGPRRGATHPDPDGARPRQRAVVRRGGLGHCRGWPTGTPCSFLRCRSWPWGCDSVWATRLRIWLVRWLRVATAAVALFALPTLASIAVSYAVAGGYYQHELVMYRQFRWLPDALTAGPTAAWAEAAGRARRWTAVVALAWMIPIVFLAALVAASLASGGVAPRIRPASAGAAGVRDDRPRPGACVLVPRRRDVVRPRGNAGAGGAGRCRIAGSRPGPSRGLHALDGPPGRGGPRGGDRDDSARWAGVARTRDAYGAGRSVQRFGVVLWEVAYERTQSLLPGGMLAHAASNIQATAIVFATLRV